MVNLTKRVAGRFRPVVEAANGRIKPDWVVVAGQETKAPAGNYYIEWRDSGVRRRLSVGPNAQDALARKMAKEAELRAIKHGLKIETEQGTEQRRPIAPAVATYLLTKGRNKPKTRAKYTLGLDYFMEACPKRYLEEITRDDVLRYGEFLQTDKQLAARSAADHVVNLLSFLKAHDIRVAKKGDIPKYTDADVEIYEQAELDSFFRRCSPEERLWYEFFLMTGMREQEVIYCCWKDVNFSAHTVRVSHKPEYGWAPKMYKGREIPVPDRLLVKLQAHKKKAGLSCPLVFPTSGCKPKLDFLDCLKRVSLNMPGRWYLHKFRATFATRHLWNGVDLRTVQAWMGHTDLDSTARYLREQRGPAVRAKVNSTFAG
jgi:integrase/recombinase XerD